MGAKTLQKSLQKKNKNLVVYKELLTRVHDSVST